MTFLIATLSFIAGSLSGVLLMCFMFGATRPDDADHADQPVGR